MNDNLVKTSCDVSISPQVESALAVQQEQTKALSKIAESLGALSTFLTTGGLQTILQGYSKANAVQGFFQGLASHDGRGALDARVIKQNALEIVAAIEAAHDKFAEVLKKKKEGPVDPELHDGEEMFREWAKKQEDLKS